MNYPGLLVLYTFTDDEVYILAVQVQVPRVAIPTSPREIS
jgi:hypothetical protein